MFVAVAAIALVVSLQSSTSAEQVIIKGHGQPPEPLVVSIVASGDLLTGQLAGQGILVGLSYGPWLIDITSGYTDGTFVSLYGDVMDAQGEYPGIVQVFGNLDTGDWRIDMFVGLLTPILVGNGTVEIR